MASISLFLLTHKHEMIVLGVLLLKEKAVWVCVSAQGDVCIINDQACLQPAKRKNKTEQ